MQYIDPKSVISPKKNWALIDVLYDEGTGGAAVALGRWDGEVVLAMRWNGTAENPLGNPQSRGIPTWFVIPRFFLDSIARAVPENKKAMLQNFFPGEQ